MPNASLDYHHDSPSLRVVDAIAAVTDTDPLELDPLYSVVDPEALDQLFQSNTGLVGSVEFEYESHTVAVRSDGTVSVDGAVHRPS